MTYSDITSICKVACSGRSIQIVEKDHLPSRWGDGFYGKRLKFWLILRPTVNFFERLTEIRK